MPKLSTSRLSINYQRTGSGPDVVMVHGIAANLVFWYLKIVPQFSPHFSVTCYDLRGHGASEMPPTGYTTLDLAGDLLALLDGLHIERADLVGHSIGGAVCLHFAALHPHRVRSLTLIESRLHCFQPIKSRDNEAFWEKHAKEFEEKGIVIPKNTPKVFYSLMEELHPLAEQGIVNPNAVPGLMMKNSEFNPKSRSAQRWLDLVTGTTFATDIQQDAGLTAEKIAAIEAPALILYGEKSHFLDSGAGLERTLKNHTSVIYPGEGHFFPVTRPDLLTAPTLDFLSQLP